MSTLFSALATELTTEPLVLTAAREIANGIDQGPIARRCLNAILTARFGGTDAEGRWSVRDAHAALELAQCLWLRSNAALGVTTAVEDAERLFAALADSLPTQSVRSEEQMVLQQFATPPQLAWAAARACALRADELVLEPSAGTGMLAIWLAKARARLTLNEISSQRRESLSALFVGATITAHDGELIHELLDRVIVPSVVLMNPPYSHGVERGADGRTAARHVRSAWQRLAESGRPVAILPDWFDVAAFLKSVPGPKALRLNATLVRAFVRQGTGITTRLVVLDKCDDMSPPVIAQDPGFAELVGLIDAVPARCVPQIPTLRPKGAGLALRLVPSVRRLPTVPIRTGAPTAATVTLAYAALETPAPIAGKSAIISPIAQAVLWSSRRSTIRHRSWNRLPWARLQPPFRTPSHNFRGV